MMSKPELIGLIQKYNSGACSAEEKALLESWYTQFELKGVADLTEMQLDEINASVPNIIAKDKTVRLWPRIAVAVSRSKFGTSLIAAAAVAAIVFGVWFYNTSYMNGRHPDAGQDLALVHQDIAPGKNGATITLANGKVIQLSDAKSGVVIGNGKLAYNDGSSVGRHPEFISGSRTSKVDKQGGGPDLPQDDVMLTAITARGQTYQFTLPDGTHVWLNADSKISFPSQFNGKERKIVLNGEGYFEVAKDKAHPFIVESKDQLVEVLGTHFNINAYDNEKAVKTTLLEGSVSVRHAEYNPEFSSGSASRNRKTTLPGRDPYLRQDDVVLKPNQQSILTAADGIKVKQVDPSDAIDWKDGEFVFHSEPLREIMRRVSRWYDVEVIYGADVPDVELDALISRNRAISQVLKMIEKTGEVHFKLEGRKVYVTR